MVEEQAVRPERQQWEEGDIEWTVGPIDVSPEVRAEAEAREAAQRREGQKKILREKLSAEARRRKGARQDG